MAYTLQYLEIAVAVLLLLGLGTRSSRSSPA